MIFICCKRKDVLIYNAYVQEDGPPGILKDLSYKVINYIRNTKMSFIQAINDFSSIRAALHIKIMDRETVRDLFRKTKKVHGVDLEYDFGSTIICMNKYVDPNCFDVEYINVRINDTISNRIYVYFKNDYVGAIMRNYSDGSYIMVDMNKYYYYDSNRNCSIIDNDGNIVMCDFDQGIVGSNVNNNETTSYISMKEY